MPSRYPLLVLVENHFDPLWRRCWKRSFVDHGRRFVSYSDLQCLYMDINLKLAAAHPEYKFMAESTIVAREYLRRRPKQKQLLRRLAAEGRFGIGATGDNIVDANMILGESLVRNYLTGLRWTEKHLGFRAWPGVRTDGFGNCAQLPQILRGCGIPWVINCTYSPVEGKYWRGLDGSTVFTDDLSAAAQGGHYAKYPPCPHCNGQGCSVCDDWGIEIKQFARLPGEIDMTKAQGYGAAYVAMYPEELLPNSELIGWVKKQSRKYNIKFALRADAEPFLRPWIDKVDSPPTKELHRGLELNPNNSGCWVTRIKLKQNLRRQEHAVFAAETLAVAAWRGVKHPYPAVRFAKIWEDLLFTMFHDCITATHIDAAYTELMDLIAEIDRRLVAVRTPLESVLTGRQAGRLSVVNLSGAAGQTLATATIPTDGKGVDVLDTAGKKMPVTSCTPVAKGQMRVEFVADVNPFAATSYSVRSRSLPIVAKTDGRRVIENERFRINADANGLTEIYDKFLRRTISKIDGFRPNELILERDDGSPWATLCSDRPRRSLVEGTKFISRETSGAAQKLQFSFYTERDYCYGTTSVTLTKGIARVDFRTELYWDNYSMRLRIALPVAIRGRYMYEVPYGVMSRKNYKPSFSWTGANGDWPAIHWAGLETKDMAVALLNKGTPSYAMERCGHSSTAILLSVLRSPVIPTYLHGPASYTMTAYDGMRDTGDHAFEYSLMAYDDTFARSSIVDDAELYNRGVWATPGVVQWPVLPTVVDGRARIASIKKAEEGNAVIVRLVQHTGRAVSAVVQMPEGFTTCFRMNLREQNPQRLPVRNNKIHLPLRAWEIATLQFE